MTQLNQECKFCKKMTAKKMHNSIPNQSTFYCSYCKHTYTMVDDNMGKRKNKKKNKNKSTTSQAAVNQKIINKATAADDSWEVEIDCVEACSKVPEKINIWFQPLAKRKVDTLMKEYTSIEWLAYLLGKKDTREVEDIFIPDQSISTARVDDVECDEYNNLSVIGVIHSHHGMGHSFSSTDHDYINGNHDISIVISHSGLAGQFRFKTPCGSYKIIEANVRLKVVLDFDDEKFIESVKPKLTKKTFVATTYGGYGGKYVNGVWVQDGYNSWPARPHTTPTPQPYVKETPTLETSSFLSEAERLELEAEVEELDFTKDLTLAEEMELLESVDNTDEQEVSQDM